MNRPAVHLALNCTEKRDIIMTVAIMGGSLSEAAGFVNQLLSNSRRAAGIITPEVKS